MSSWRQAFLRVTVLLGVGGAPAFGASSATVHIDVTIAATLSVSVSGAASSTQTANWNAATANARLASASTATVRNDTGGLTEKWALSTNGNSINTAGGAGNWTLDTTTDTLPGADAFTVQAVFGSSKTAAGGCPAGSAGDWDGSYASELTTAAQTYTSTLFADSTLNNDGTPNPDITVGAADGRMFAGSQRALCWRLIMPASTSTVDPQNIQIIVTAQLP